MASSVAARTLGVVVLHRPGCPTGELPAVRDLASQVDELLIVLNGGGDQAAVPAAVGVVSFRNNRGTAAAWNAAVAEASRRDCRYLYVLDQDSSPCQDAVATALDVIRGGSAAAVVQPARRDRLRLDRFPWNCVASGSLFDVEVLRSLGGFDERLFVDEVDHEMLARITAAGHRVTSLATPTITHRTGDPRDIRFLGRTAVVSGHGPERRRLQGFSAGLLVRRYLGPSPSTSVRLLLRYALTGAKDLVAGERLSTWALLSGLAAGVSTGSPPNRAAARACPYCDGPLLGRFGEVPDWRFGTPSATDVYWCAACGSLGAGRVPDAAEVASWYSDYYTHAPERPPPRVWSSVWPTRRRREERARVQRYLAPAGTTGRFLEVGTGSGERLVEFADAGWEVVGQDPDPKAGVLAREHGIEVHTCSVDELVGREKPFDLIGLNHVLEHVAEPADLLRSCAALLTSSGRICVVAPNARSLGRLLFGRWWFGLEQPRHLAIPTLESLRRVAASIAVPAVHAETTAANAAVILGGSLARPIEARLPDGPLRRGAGFLMHLMGQALGRVAVAVDGRRGEELVWVGRRPDA